MTSNPDPTSSSAQPGSAQAPSAAAPGPAHAPAPRPAPALEVRLTRRWMAGLAIVLALTTVGSVAAGARALWGLRDAGQTREQLAAIHGELIRIRQVLESEQEPDDGDEDVQAQRTARLSISGAPILGSPNAPLTMVEFTDFQCPFCARFHSQTFPLLRKAHVDAGRLRYIAMDFPLTGIHPDAFRAARASHCGEQQGRYWDVHEALYLQRGRLGREAILAAVKGLGMNAPRFTACLDSDALDARIERGLSQGRALGVSGTPTFVLGRTEGSSVVGRVIVGAQPFEVFDDAITALLQRS
jgi:protein-disulfide isomerase